MNTTTKHICIIISVWCIAQAILSFCITQNIFTITDLVIIIATSNITAVAYLIYFAYIGEQKAKKVAEKLKQAGIQSEGDIADDIANIAIKLKPVYHVLERIDENTINEIKNFIQFFKRIQR